MNRIDLANLMYPNVVKTPEDYEEIYPKRNLSENAIVTRQGPSPTGFVHMGHLRTFFIASKVAKDSGGLFYLRIEDTDDKRTIENGISGILRDLDYFDIKMDEGPISDTEEVGKYGPYIQSKRLDIYHTYAKYMVENDLAYPCFCTEKELANIRNNQEAKKERIGYYGKYAKCRCMYID